ncbi:NADPH-dependent FMN reductase [Streptomyces monticola]|uniref:NADPH-dependent FMN reductase n=1 Tax=Streptomyces monticola TaxID=2666263 RepID=A0ABW2JYY3_9ACTN
MNRSTADRSRQTGDDHLSLVIIIGSVHQGRSAAAAANWFARLACLHGGFDVDVIDLAHAHLPAAGPEHNGIRPPAVRELAPWLADADAFAVVTPQGAQGVPWALRNTVAWFHEEWRAKPVAFVSYGPGCTADELRQLFSAAGATPVRGAVDLPGDGEPFDARGRPLDPGHCEPAAERLLDDLAYWARPLRTARHA